MATTTVTGQWLKPNGDPASGRVTFRLVAETYHDGLDAIFPRVPVTAVLDDDGSISVELEPTSGVDAGFDATDMTYEVVEKISGSQRDAYYVDIPTAPAVDLGTLVTYDDPPTVTRQLVDVDLASVGYLPESTADTRYAPLRVSDVPHIADPLPPPAPVSSIYNPGVIENDETTTDTTWSDVPGTGLTFVVPPSGEVLVTLSARAWCAAGGALQWRVKDSGGGIVESQHNVVGDSSDNTVQNWRTTVTRVTTDSAGDPLVPGETVTWVWQHRTTANSVTARTSSGGGSGASLMHVEPVSHRVTDRVLTPTVTDAVTEWPLWLCHDRLTLLGASTSAGLAYSLDGGDTWARVGGSTLSAAGGVIAARQLDNGEVIVATPYTGGTAGQLFVSSGFADNPATATFTSVLEAEGASTARFTNGWSLDAYGPLVLAAEYGPKASSVDMARYVYLSQDYGQTFEPIFDLFEQTGVGVEAHLHGVAYDPWWDAIWLLSGDATTEDGPTATWVSFDLGQSWTRVDDNQKCTTIVPMPTCILFGTDAGPNGVYRIPRTSKRYLKGEIAYAIDLSGSITHVSQMAFKGRASADTPALFAFLTAGATNGPGRLIATHDGYTFREVWNDAGQAYTGYGLMTVVGPLSDGRILGWLSRSSSDHRLLELQ